MATRFTEFCGERFWNTSQLVDNSWPQFTQCFLHTALIWIPCAFLLVFLPYYVYSIRANSTHTPFRFTFVFSFKLVCCALLVLTSLAQLIHKLTDNDKWSDAAKLGDGLWILAYVTMGVMTSVEQKLGARGLAVPFFFWLLSSLSNLVPLYTIVKLQIILQLHEEDAFHFTSTIVIFVLQIASLLMTFIVDDVKGDTTDGQRQRQPRRCPQSTCSFPAYLTFWWMLRTLRTGFSRDLDEKDLWRLDKEDRSATVVPVFEEIWKNITSNQDSNRHDAPNRTNSGLEPDSNGSTETTPLLNGNATQPQSTPPPRHVKKGSLLKALGKMFWLELLFCLILKLMSDLIFLLSPICLEALIKALEDNSESRHWHSYVLSLALFLTTSVKGVFFGHALFRAMRVGLRIKSVLIAAIYAKVLSMNTSTRNRVATGEILNMATVDTQGIMEKIDTLLFGITTPVQVIVTVAFLYKIIGWSVFVGVAVLLLQVPINIVLAKKQKHHRQNNMTNKDARVKLYSEILNAIKVLKLYAWEPSFREKIRSIRSQELSTLFKLVHINSLTGLIWDMAPYVVMLTTFTTFITSDRTNQMTVSVAFVSLAYFNILRAPLNLFATVIVITTQTWVSIQRINNFLQEEELDKYVTHHDSDKDISIKDGTFTWDREGQATLKHINMDVKRGSLVAVVGTVGSGKSSLISAILGEMEKVKGTVNTKASIAYVPQQAWVLNATVKDNIVFGKPLDDVLYDTVLRDCELERDLDILPAGDKTEIGEKGINVSGGQKQRISVARAVYSDSDVYLFDDPLSAVDSHVGKAIFKNVVGPSGILKNKTRVLVTHGVHWLPMVDEILVMADGVISERGSYEQLVSHDGPFAQFLKTHLSQVVTMENDEELADIHRDMLEKLDTSVEELTSSQDSTRSRNTKDPKVQSLGASSELKASTKSSAATTTAVAAGQLTTVETVETGQVSFKVLSSYFKSAGVCFLFQAFFAYCAFQAFAAGAIFWLDEWAQDSDLSNTTVPDFNSSNDFYLGIYGLYGAVQVLCLVIFNWIFWTRMVHASRDIHARLANRLLHYPMSFFDTTPSGRVLNRVSRDVETVDNHMPMIIRDFTSHTSLVLITGVVIMVKNPLTIVIVLPVMGLFYLCQKFYIPTSRQLKRIDAVTRSPVYMMICETLNGTASIRAYQAEQRYRHKCKQLVDNNQVYFFASHGALRWLQWNLDILASLVIFAAAIAQILLPFGPASDVGLSVSYALQLSGTMIWMTKDISEIETHIVSVERLKEYSELETEAEWIIPNQRPSASWPEHGQVVFNNYKTRYREGLNLVLKGVSLTIPAASKVGIVGRTGAGKSSLTLSLFRLIEAAGGSILIDGVDIADMGLHDLRSHLTILPQDPVLFSGSLRMNLDPFREYSDPQLWTALEQAHLRPAVEQMTGGLSFDCGEEGSRLSVGQRQLVCLARALLRKSKILVLDEATAAVDMDTDSLIQATLRTAFTNCTVISIAHRLRTVLDCDKIVVMENGEVKEFASPNDLLDDPSSLFYSLAKDAGIVS